MEHPDKNNQYLNIAFYLRMVSALLSVRLALDFLLSFTFNIDFTPHTQSFSAYTLTVYITSMSVGPQRCWKKHSLNPPKKSFPDMQNIFQTLCFLSPVSTAGVESEQLLLQYEYTVNEKKKHDAIWTQSNFSLTYVGLVFMRKSLQTRKGPFTDNGFLLSQEFTACCSHFIDPLILFSLEI